MSFLSQLYWRSATKDFDPHKKVPNGDLQKILRAIRMAPSSYGLQPFHVIIIDDQQIRKNMQPLARGQIQITAASHVLAFCSRTDIAEKRIAAHIEQLEKTGNVAAEKLLGYESMMRSAVGALPADKLKSWADRQTYIALAFAMAACAELGVDSCPIEGFDPAGTDALLGISENMKSVALLPIGYRLAEPKIPKIRFPEDDLFSYR